MKMLMARAFLLKQTTKKVLPAISKNDSKEIQQLHKHTTKIVNDLICL